MKVIKPYFEVLEKIDGVKILKNIERAGRICYKSEHLITDDSYLSFAKRIINNGHEAVIEHESISVLIVCDRGVSHEIVRHRLGSYCQESTRYCNYSNEKFGENLTFIKPYFWNEDEEKYKIWEKTMKSIEYNYLELIDLGAQSQEARSILPNSLKTEIVVTFNIREWRHFLKLRTTKAAHPQMRESITPILKDFQKLIPILFDDIEPFEL